MASDIQRALRAVIRAELLHEAAIAPGAAITSGLALMARKSEGQHVLVLYDPVILDKGLQEAAVPPGVVKGVIVLHEGLHGFYSVARSAAEKGYGPIMYDAALSLGVPVMPDEPGSVTLSAQNVWRHYATQRASEIDVTPLPERGHEQPWLNAAYRLKQSAAMPGLRMRHKIFTAHNRRTRNALERIILTYGLGFFHERIVPRSFRSAIQN